MKNAKLLTKTTFSYEIDCRKTIDPSSSYIEHILEFMKECDIEDVSVPRLLTDDLKARIEKECGESNLIDGFIKEPEYDMFALDAAG